MTINASVTGLQVRIRASITYPTGFTVSQFADDADPFDLPSVAIADAAMGPNGDMIGWAKATPKDATLNVMPGSVDDINLNIIFQANDPSNGLAVANDVITATAIYPSGEVVIATGGRMISGPPGLSGSSAGRLKTPAYAFKFQRVTRLPVIA